MCQASARGNINPHIFLSYFVFGDAAVRLVTQNNSPKSHDTPDAENFIPPSLDDAFSRCGYGCLEGLAALRDRPPKLR